MALPLLARLVNVTVPRVRPSVPFQVLLPLFMVSVVPSWLAVVTVSMLSTFRVPAPLTTPVRVMFLAVVVVTAELASRMLMVDPEVLVTATVPV